MTTVNKDMFWKNASNLHFLLFLPAVFSTLSKRNQNLAKFYVICKLFQYGPAQKFVIWHRMKNPEIYCLAKS